MAALFIFVIYRAFSVVFISVNGKGLVVFADEGAVFNDEFNSGGAVFLLEIKTHSRAAVCENVVSAVVSGSVFIGYAEGFCRKLLVAGIEGAILKGDRDVAVLGGNACAVFEGNTLNGGVGIEIGIGPC